MQLQGMSFDELSEVVTSVSAAFYDGNVKLGGESRADGNGRRGPKARFVLRVSQSRGKGARFSPSFFRLKDGSRRRTVAACWHAHRDVMAEIFARRPDAVLVTGLARYNGRDDFERKFEATGETNVGAPVEPVTIEELCDCHWGSTQRLVPRLSA